jgi:hypothetical protein
MSSSANSYRPFSPLRYAVVILAIGQPVGTLLFDRLSTARLESSAAVSPIVPPGVMFAIWGLIFTACVAWGVLQARRSTFEDAVRDSLAWPLIVAFGGCSIWTAAASLSQSSPLTLPAFLILIGGLVAATRLALINQAAIATWSRPDRVVLWTMLGVYLGWTSIAFFINIAVVVQSTGATTSGTWGTVWQTLVLLAGAGVAVAIVLWTRRLYAYSVTAIYAFVGAGISSSIANFDVLAWVCGAAVVAVVITALRARSVSRARATLRGDKANSPAATSA